ncbi:unnamed protein product [Aphanomyces euteiches]|uniref:EF-hand domain-containing protein n=1 Tax=Aphanomyces euteiches TaxID=100861 RepID=A0A6G0XAM8_9STRA|nr:hypothetical protein Ae201684_006840 [Aphanomyces euteiches]KAH9087545.1 hypothetical protein Ae201684P_000947 [Aphanomyces euteiches]KAH9140294.1 hypothetical protein AeRB84_015431 [Aphanomyces euteiches]
MATSSSPVARKFIDAYIDGVWNVYDCDLNGYLERKEARTFVLSLLEELATEGLYVRPDELDFDAYFDAYDQDGNGHLSRSEASVFVEQLMAPMSDEAAAPVASNDAETKAFLDNYMNDVWATYDGDHSGFLERKEARAFVDKLIQDMVASGLDVQGFDFDACFDAYDVDGNNQLSRKELRVFVEQLMGLQ